MVTYQERNSDDLVARFIFECWQFLRPNRGRSPSTRDLPLFLAELLVRGVMCVLYCWRHEVGYNFT